MNTPVERGSGAGNKTALLVIGYGNELRSDDGVGPKTAAAVAEWNLPGVRTLSCHQLTPELAVPIAASHCVVFIDAAVGSKEPVGLRELAPAGPDQIMAHAADPRLLLRLAKDIFGRSPSAFMLTIPVSDFAFGEELSTRAKRGLKTALKKIRGLLDPSI